MYCRALRFRLDLTARVPALPDSPTSHEARTGSHRSADQNQKACRPVAVASSHGGIFSHGLFECRGWRRRRRHGRDERLERELRPERVGKRRDSGGEIQQEPERAAVHTFERHVPPAASASATGSVAVASRPRGRTATPGTTLVETLSPQARLADQLEEGETGAELETHQTCEIACWRGYVTWQFYVESESPHDVSLASPYFRAPGKGAPEQSAVALQAHAVLVEALVEAGWEPEGYGEEWFSERFQRPNA